MKDPLIDCAITDGLLAFFRQGKSFPAIQPPPMAFAESLRLLRLHWAFSHDMQQLLEYLLRRHGEIVSSSTIGIQETTGSIRGSYIWPRSYIRQHLTANPALAIFRDIRRTYEVGPNKVLQFVVLSAFRLLEPYAARVDLINSPYGLAIRRTAELALRARRVLELRQITSSFTGSAAIEPSIQDVRQASQSPKRLYALAAKLYGLYRKIVLNKVESILEVISGTLISPLFAWQRFELFAVLHIGLALHRLLGVPAHLHDLTGATRGPAVTVGSYAIFWGVRPPDAKPASEISQRRQHLESMLQRFGLSTRSGRSDIVIADIGHSEVLAIVECKYSSREDVSSAQQFREAANQVLDYVEDYEGNANQRLSKSAIVMRRLPSEVSRRGGVAGTSDLIAMSATDLLHGSESLREWLNRLSVSEVGS